MRYRLCFFKWFAIFPVMSGSVSSNGENSLSKSSSSSCASSSSSYFWIMEKASSKGFSILMFFVFIIWKVIKYGLKKNDEE